MSASSPARKLRTKTTEFLRGPSQVQGISHDHADDHERPLPDDPSPKKRGSRIPFIGRGRKKSLQSDISVQDVKEARTSGATTRSRSLLDEQGGVLPTQSRASTSNPSLPSAVHSTFGAKFAAQLSSKSKSLLSHSKSTKKHAKSSGTETDYASDSLYPGRGTSIDSKSSRRSRSVTPRPSQPQPVAQPPPVQPTITVSRPTDPYSLDEFEGLFTKPRNKIKPKPLYIVRANPASPYHSDDAYLSSPTSDSFPTQSTPTSVPRLAVSTDSYSDSPSCSTPSSSTPDATAAGSFSKRSSGASAASASSSIRSSRKQSPPGDRRLEDAFGTERDLDSAEESEAVSMLSVKSLPLASSMRSRKSSASSVTVTSLSSEKRRSLNTVSSRLTPSASEKRRNPAVSLGSSQPPSVPLPLPPLNTPPLAPPAPPPRGPLPSIPTEPSSSYIRPRAHTISSSLSGPSSDSPSLSASPTEKTLRRNRTTTSPSGKSPKSPASDDANRDSGSSSSSTPTLTKSHSPDPVPSPLPLPNFPPPPIADSDIDNASISQLRDALRQRNTQFDDLVLFIHNQSSRHESEKKGFERKLSGAESDKKVLEGKINSLEREAIRRDKEIKGLTWLVMNNRGPGGPGSLSDPEAAVRVIGLSARSAVGGSSRTSTVSTSGTGTPDLGLSDDSSSRSTNVTTPSSSSFKLPIYRKIHIRGIGDDSGAESSATYLTSTSMDGEGEVVSAPESSSRPQLSLSSTGSALKPRRTMRKLKLVESVNSRTFGLNNSNTSTSPSSSPSLPISIPDNVPYLLKPNKRASSSVSSGSTASPPISPKSPSPAMAIFPSTPPSAGQQTQGQHVLSAIPESPPGSKSGFGSLFGSGESKMKDRERKTSTSKIPFSPPSSPRESSSSNSTSASLSLAIPSSNSPPAVPPKVPPKTPSKCNSTKNSSSSSSTQRLTPSEAYALNLKKGRPPSIAQVLDRGLGLASGSDVSSSNNASTTGSRSRTNSSVGLMEESFGGRSRALLGLTSGSGAGVKNVT